MKRGLWRGHTTRPALDGASLGQVSKSPSRLTEPGQGERINAHTRKAYHRDKKGSPRVHLGVPDVLLNTKGSVIHTASTVKWTKEVCVPWALRLVASRALLACSGLLGVDEVVGVIAQSLADDEGSLPRGGELVLAGCSLDGPEHQVSFPEGEGLDLLAVVAA